MLFFIYLCIYSLVIPIIAEQTIKIFGKISLVLLNQIEFQISKISILINSNFLDLNYKEVLKNLNEGIGSFLKKLISKLFFSSLAIVNLLSFIIVTPVVTWYFLKDWNSIVLFFNKNIPSKYEKNSKKKFKGSRCYIGFFFEGTIFS